MPDSKPPQRDLSAYGKSTYKWVGGKSKFIDELMVKYEKRARDVVVRAVIDMTDEIKDNTPVDSGALVAHWDVALNKMGWNFDKTRVDPTRSQFTDGDKIMKFKPGKDRILIYNPTPYAAVIEAIGSKSTAPGQMVAQQRLAWPQYVEQAASDLGLS